ncbi:hypothetical protein DFH06DRAFT_1230169 [Mycena polygramma]|nr:hypothetical protein DFH06DRAFT_1230169 [Mycena polygramma]
METCTAASTTSLPQELIDTIVGEVTDTDSLRACTLVSPRFRWPSQRILLHSLTLNGHLDSAVCALLRRSPHILDYITRLKIKLPPGLPNLIEAHSLRWILTRLTRVQRCVITGVFLDARWGDLTSDVTSDILGFLVRQPLQSLHISFLKDIPQAVFLRFITSAPTLSFDNVDINQVSDVEAPYSLVDSHSPSVNSLLLNRKSTSVSEILRRPAIMVHTGTLSRLSVTLDQNADVSLVQATSRTLQYLRLDCKYFAPSPFSLGSLPPLPCLRSVEVALHFSAPWSVGFVYALLKSSAATIEELIITYAPFAANGKVTKIPDSLESWSLALLALQYHLLGNLTSWPCPRVCWRVGLMPAHRDEHLKTFAALMQHAMPQLHSQGKLVFEHFEPNWDGYIGSFKK